MWILKNKTLGESGVDNVNFLYNTGKFYIMDNHLAAAWCWQRHIRQDIMYTLFHIDKHYDLLDNVSIEEIESFRNQITSDNFDEYRQIPSTYGFPLIRYDNYIHVFLKLFPNLINDFYFATHEDGTYSDEIESYKPTIWDLPDNIDYWISQRSRNKCIFNLDLDYFFLEKDSTEYQFLTDDYIKALCVDIEKAIDKIDVITISMSPEFCGGWEPSFRVLGLITNHFKLDFIYP